MNTFKITFEDGNTITTGMNATLEQAEKYYIGQYFNFGDTEAIPYDKMVKAVKVEQLTDCNGWTNEATYLANMHLSNNEDCYKEISKVRKEGKMFTGIELERKFFNLKITVNNSNNINWNEIADYWNNENFGKVE